MKNEVAGIGMITPATEGDPCPVCAAVEGGDRVPVPEDAKAAERAVSNAIAFGAVFLQCNRLMNQGECRPFFTAFCEQHLGIMEGLINRMAIVAKWDAATTDRIVLEHFGFSIDRSKRDVH